MRSSTYLLLLFAFVIWYVQREFAVPVSASASARESFFTEEIGFKPKYDRASVALPQIAPNPAIQRVKEQLQRHAYMEARQQQQQRDPSLPKSVRDLVSNLTVYRTYNYGKETKTAGFLFKNGRYKNLSIVHASGANGSAIKIQQPGFEVKYVLDENSNKIFTYNNDPYSIVVRDSNRLIYLKMFSQAKGKIGYYGWLIQSPYSNPKVTALATVAAQDRAPASDEISKYLQTLPER